MHTELYCKTLDKLDSTQAIRAIHEAWLQLCACDSELGEDTCLDNDGALGALARCLRDAGHPAFVNIIDPDAPQGSTGTTDHPHIPLSDLRTYIKGVIAYWMRESPESNYVEFIRDAIINLRWYLEVNETRGRAFDPDYWKGAN